MVSTLVALSDGSATGAFASAPSVSGSANPLGWLDTAGNGVTWGAAGATGSGAVSITGAGRGTSAIGTTGCTLGMDVDAKGDRTGGAGALGATRGTDEEVGCADVRCVLPDPDAGRGAGGEPLRTPVPPATPLRSSSSGRRRCA